MKYYNYYTVDGNGTHMGNIKAENEEQAMEKVFRMYPYAKKEYTSVSKGYMYENGFISYL